MSNPFPQTSIRHGVYDALTGALSVPVVQQKRPESDLRSPLIMIDPPVSSPRGDIKSDTGHEVELRIRVHTRYAKGQADVSKREDIAGDVHTALGSLSLSGHHLLHLPEPSVSFQEYDVQGKRAYDALLDYQFKTQTL